MILCSRCRADLKDVIEISKEEHEVVKKLRQAYLDKEDGALRLARTEGEIRRLGGLLVELSEAKSDAMGKDGV